MSINLSTFWTTWGVFSGNTSASNQYDLWRSLIMTDGTPPSPTPTPTPTPTPVPSDWYLGEYNCQTPYADGFTCPVQNLPTAADACQDYIDYGAASVFYWYGSNASYPNIGDPMSFSPDLSGILAGAGTFWISDGTYGYEVGNDGYISNKTAC